MGRARYISVPLHILQLLHKDKRECLHKALAYEVCKLVDKGYQPEEAGDYLGINLGDNDIKYLAEGKKIKEKVEELNDPTPHLKLQNLINFLSEDKTVRELDILACDIAGKSILGKHKQTITNYERLLTRMMGFSTKIPEKLEPHLLALKDRYTRKNGELSKHKMRGLVEDAEIAGFRLLMLTQKDTKIAMRGFCLGDNSKTDYGQMKDYCLRRSKSYKRKKLREKKQSAMEKNQGKDFNP